MQLSHWAGCKICCSKYGSPRWIFVQAKINICSWKFVRHFSWMVNITWNPNHRSIYAHLTHPLPISSAPALSIYLHLSSSLDRRQYHVAICWANWMEKGVSLLKISVHYAIIIHFNIFNETNVRSPLLWNVVTSINKVRLYAITL